MHSRLGLFNPESEKRKHAEDFVQAIKDKKERAKIQEFNKKKSLRDVLFEMNPHAFTKK